MSVLALDTETTLFGPNNMAPRLVCVSITAEYGEQHLIHQSEFDPTLIGKGDIMVGQNIAYDMCVLAAHVGKRSFLEKIFDEYAAGRIHCTMLQQQLIDIFHGTLGKKSASLEELALRYLGKQLDKNTWRLRYGELRDVPLDQWPDGAKQYALDDAEATLGVYHAQVASVEPIVIANTAWQSAYDFALKLMQTHGVHTDAGRVAEFQAHVEAELVAVRKKLVEAKLMVQEKNGHYKRNMKAIKQIVTEAYNGCPPVTDAGNVSTAAEVLENAPRTPQLALVADYVGLEKLHSTYLPVLQEGVTQPIHPNFRILETGRRGANKNMQTLPRAPGVRECYKPRDGFVFLACDYDVAELRSWAQIMVDLFGVDAVPMAQLFRADPNADPHTKFGAETFLKISYNEGLRLKKAGDKAMKAARQKSKAVNFGLPGGMGAATLAASAKAYGVDMPLDEAAQIKEDWLDLWNARPYFEYVSEQVETNGYIIQHRSNRVRGGASFCAAANSYFQGLTADGAYRALFEAQKACYVIKGSPLYGSRCWNINHDEIFAEVPRDHASEAAAELSRIMNQAMSEFCPDIPIVSTPSLMSHWCKEVKDVYVDGKLQIFEVPAVEYKKVEVAA